jgi:hypothetical protein
MKRNWQEKKEIYLNTFLVDVAYKIFSCSGELVVYGKYKKYENGRYYFENSDGLFKANLNKLKLPVGIVEIKENML